MRGTCSAYLWRVCQSPKYPKRLLEWWFSERPNGEIIDSSYRIHPPGYGSIQYYDGMIEVVGFHFQGDAKWRLDNCLSGRWET
ncbi:hypothetical protein AFLA70_167g001581 [Aspergillus flavus AF70]|nr:hypothetical protein AFLA70_167g001581 [Aspergillus flavus AF70]